MRRKASWRRQTVWFAILALAAFFFLGVKSVYDVGPKNFHIYRVPAGADTILVDSTDFDTDGDGNRDFARVTQVGIKYDNSGIGIDTLGLHLMRGWREMPYPRGSVDVWAHRLALMRDIHRGVTPTGAARQGQVLRFKNNSAGTVWVYIWGD